MTIGVYYYPKRGQRPMAGDMANIKRWVWSSSTGRVCVAYMEPEEAVSASTAGAECRTRGEERAQGDLCTPSATPRCG